MPGKKKKLNDKLDLAMKLAMAEEEGKIPTPKLKKKDPLAALLKAPKQPAAEPPNPKLSLPGDPAFGTPLVPRAASEPVIPMAQLEGTPKIPPALAREYVPGTVPKPAPVQMPWEIPVYPTSSYSPPNLQEPYGLRGAFTNAEPLTGSDFRGKLPAKVAPIQSFGRPSNAAAAFRNQTPQPVPNVSIPAEMPNALSQIPTPQIPEYTRLPTQPPAVDLRAKAALNFPIPFRDTPSLVAEGLNSPAALPSITPKDALSALNRNAGLPPISPRDAASALGKPAGIEHTDLLRLPEWEGVTPPPINQLTRTLPPPPPDPLQARPPIKMNMLDPAQVRPLIANNEPAVLPSSLEPQIGDTNAGVPLPKTANYQSRPKIDSFVPPTAPRAGTSQYDIKAKQYQNYVNDPFYGMGGDAAPPKIPLPRNPAMPIPPPEEALSLPPRTQLSLPPLEESLSLPPKTGLSLPPRTNLSLPPVTGSQVDSSLSLPSMAPTPPNADIPTPKLPTKMSPIGRAAGLAGVGMGLAGLGMSEYYRTHPEAAASYNRTKQLQAEKEASAFDGLPGASILGGAAAALLRDGDMAGRINTIQQATPQFLGDEFNVLDPTVAKDIAKRPPIGISPNAPLKAAPGVDMLSGLPMPEPAIPTPKIKLSKNQLLRNILGKPKGPASDGLPFFKDDLE